MCSASLLCELLSCLFWFIERHSIYYMQNNTGRNVSCTSCCNTHCLAISGSTEGFKFFGLFCSSEFLASPYEEWCFKKPLASLVWTTTKTWDRIVTEVIHYGKCREAQPKGRQVPIYQATWHHTLIRTLKDRFSYLRLW